MKKIVKILPILLTLAIILMLSMPLIVSATDASQAQDTVTSLFEKDAQGTEGITNVGGNIVSIVTTIGIIVAVIVLLVLGIKYMMGSAAEKAEYKKTMIPYLVGAVLIFGASAIAKAVIAMTANITNA